MAYTIDILSADELSAYKRLIDLCFGSSQELEVYRRYRETASYRIYTIKEGGALLGTATVVPIELFTFGFQPCLMLFNVAVDPDCQGKGVGKELLRHILAEGKAQGYKSVSLTCLESAEPAHKLYESLGFERRNSRKYELLL